MKRLLLFVILFFACAANNFSQSQPRQSKNVLQARFDSLRIVNRTYYLHGKIDSMPPSNALMLQLARKLRNDSSFCRAYGLEANYFSVKGDYSLALEYDIKAMEAADHGYKPSSATFRGNIANIYMVLGNYEAALQYLRDAEKYMVYDRAPNAVFIPSALANVYVELKKPDSALKYVQLAFRINSGPTRRNIKDPFIRSNITASMGGIYGTFARVYDLLHDPDLANFYYRKAIRYGDSLHLQGTMTRTTVRYGRYLAAQQKDDEAKNYGLKGFDIANKNHLKDVATDAADLLYNLYDRQSAKDSAYYYLKVKNLYQDSVAAEQKTNQLQGLIINQHLKEAEQQAKTEEDAEQRHRNIEYALIALGIVAFVILFLLISRNIVVNPRVIEVAGVIGLLIIFEFINLVIHPFLAEFTRDSPLPMLLILVAIAAIIVPLHHRLESWVKTKLVEKNKAIRFEAAKRTVEQFGGQKPDPQWLSGLKSEIATYCTPDISYIRLLKLIPFMRRRLLLVISVVFFFANGFSQSAHKSKNPLQAQFDSLKRINRMYFLTGKIDSMPASNASLLRLAEKLHQDSTFAQVYATIGNYFSAKADFSGTLEYDFKALENANHGYKKYSPLLYTNVAANYNRLGNYKAALHYLDEAKRYLAYGSPITRAYIPEIFAATYVDMKKPDSALKYVQIAFQANTELYHRDTKDIGLKNNTNLTRAGIYRIFGEVYEMLSEPELVNYYYKKSIRLSDSLNLQESGATTARYYGRYLLGQKKYNEAKNYGTKSFSISRRDHFRSEVVDASGLLYDLYAQQNNKDSAYYFLKINHLYQDSLAAEQKANQLQALIINQQLKDAEQQAKAEQDTEHRKRNIEYAIIAFSLVVLVMLFLLLSRSIIVNTRVIEVVGVIALLILFEFINLVIHPYLAEFTNDSPLLMLLILVAIAAIIVPLHHRLEHWVKHKLVEKNKIIRLEAAKRTIEQLGG